MPCEAISTPVSQWLSRACKRWNSIGTFCLFNLASNLIRDLIGHGLRAFKDFDAIMANLPEVAESLNVGAQAVANQIANQIRREIKQTERTD